MRDDYEAIAAMQAEVIASNLRDDLALWRMVCGQPQTDGDVVTLTRHLRLTDGQDRLQRLSETPARYLPPSLNRFLSERPEPTPEEQFDACLAEHASEIGRQLVRGRSPLRERTWLDFALPIGFLAAVIGVLVWRVLW